MSLAVFDFRFTGIHGPLVISPCGDNFQIRSKGFDSQLKTDLIISLTGSAVADGGSAFFAGNFNQLLGDEGPCHGGSQQILVLIYGMCFYTGHYIFVTEFIDNVQDIKLGSAAEFSSLFQAVQFFRLPAVDADTNDLIIKVFFQPGMIAVVSSPPE